ncbi:MAG: tRNA pseudouridine(38-40) synthase TruA [Candidatus Izemoplasmatales bacterium]
MFDKFDESVALKIDDLIIFNKDNVIEYLNNHQEIIDGFHVTDHDFFQMDYGYNKLNQPVKIGYKNGSIQRLIIKTKDYPKKRLKMVISYDGTNYHGFQIQDNEQTIQGLLSKFISLVNNKKILVQGASRTDAFVHANEQVIHFDDDSNLSPKEWLSYLNHQLPKDIYVKSVETTHPLFHCRYDVFEKEYIYKIKLGEYDPFLVNYTWNIEYLDFLRLDDQLKKIIGTYDFTSFSKSEKSDNIRTVYDAGYKIEDDILMIYIKGNGFLRYMVRLIVNHIVNFATKKTDIDIIDIINEKSRKNTKDLAKASGLYLNKINY